MNNEKFEFIVKNLRDLLKGDETTFLDLDNKMMQSGFLSEYECMDYCLEDGSCVFTYEAYDDKEEQFLNVDFKVRVVFDIVETFDGFIDAEIKVTSVEKF